MCSTRRRLRCPCSSGVQDEDVFSVLCEGCDECHACDVPEELPQCIAPLENTEITGANATLKTLRVRPGYWRATNTSVAILACYNAEACLGGRTGTPGYCQEGYNGPCEQYNACSSRTTPSSCSTGMPPTATRCNAQLCISNRNKLPLRPI